MGREELLHRVATLLGHEDPGTGLAAILNVLGDAGVRPASNDAVDPAGTPVDVPAVELEEHPALSREQSRVVARFLGVAVSRVRQVRALEEATERLDMLSRASFEGLMIHENGVIVEANQRLSELTGYERDELLGPNTLSRCVAPEDVPTVFANMRSGYEGVYTIGGVRKDGSRFRAELQTKQGHFGQRPVRIVAVRDVTERERQTQLLLESEQRFRQLSRAVFDVIVSSREGIVVEVDGLLESLIGYSPEEMVGRGILDFVTPEAHEEVQHILAEQRLDPYQSLLVHRDGRRVPVEITPIVGPLEGNPTRVAGIRDLTRQKREESERLALEQRIAQSQRIDSLGVLAGGIAHDFNNLLLGILGHAQNLLQGSQEAETRQGLAAIIAGGERAANLTAQMLAYAGRGDRGEREALEMSELIRELSELLSAALSKKARLVLELEPGTVVLGHRATLSQLVMNLLTNASDALGAEVGLVHVGCRTVDAPDARWQNALNPPAPAVRYVELDVRDDGCGMTPDTVARVFEPFFTTKAGQGHGLGLAAALGIVRAHGGAILVESTLGKGSRFSILLPSIGTKPKPKSIPPRVAPTSGGRILVIDDEALVRSFMRACLTKTGYVVVEAGDGTTALETLERESFDLLVLDMTMPDIDGMEVVTRLRNAGHDVPILITSGYVDVAVERGLDPSSFQGFLQKPFRVESLLKAVASALGSAKSG